MHACAGAAIFVQMGVKKFSEMCVRVRAYTPFRCGCAPHVRTLSFFVKNLFFIDKRGKCFENFCEICVGAGARVGTKNGVRVHAPYITIFV